MDSYDWLDINLFDYIEDDSGWNIFFNEQKDNIKKIEEQLEHCVNVFKEDLKIFPPQHLVFNTFNLCRFEDLKIVIIGQDPYHSAGQAMGLSFSVPKNIKIPPSLVNIYKEINNDIGKKCNKDGDLTNWAKQGMLLLNASLTVLEHKPNSHYKIWNKFTEDIIKYISDKKDKVVFLLWGGFAKSKKKFIDEDKHSVLTANHPSPLSANRGGWFGCKHFSKTNEILSCDFNW